MDRVTFSIGILPMAALVSVMYLSGWNTARVRSDIRSAALATYVFLIVNLLAAARSFWYFPAEFSWPQFVGTLPYERLVLFFITALATLAVHAGLRDA